MKKLIIGSRGSALALWQANHVARLIDDRFQLASEIRIIKTKGDKILDTPLAKIGGKGLFTKELEELLLQDEIDLAVHSLKDVPIVMPEGLELIAMTQRDDARDCFISQKYPSLADLPLGAKIGTTSLRRTMQLKAIRPDLDTQSLRGNVQTRLQRLEDGDFDAIILALAGLKRLDLVNGLKYVHPLEIEEMIPAMGQGALGIQCKKDGTESSALNALREKLSLLDDPHTRYLCGCEREFVGCLDGGCQVPIGVHARLQDARLVLQAKIGLPDGSEMLEDFRQGEVTEYLQIARALAQSMIDRGVKELLRRAENMIP